MYLPHETEPDNIYVFATKGGVPTNPDWYYNLTAAGDGSIERGTETYKPSVLLTRIAVTRPGVVTWLMMRMLFTPLGTP